MKDMNVVSLVGRLTRDVTKTTTSGDRIVVNFSLASNRGKNRDGQDLGTSFIKCRAWNKTGELIASLASKGTGMLVQGSLYSESYKDRNNVSRIDTGIIVNDFLVVSRPRQRTAEEASADDATAGTPVYSEAGPEPSDEVDPNN